MKLRPMFPEEYQVIWGKFSNWYMNSIQIRMQCGRDSQLKKSLIENKKFCNIHSGKRCFILGNGPSIENVNSEKIKDEIVFTVNESMRWASYEDFKPNYHFFLDRYYFSLDEMNTNDKEVIEALGKLRKMKDKPIVFIPYPEHENDYNCSWLEGITYSYFCDRLYMYDGFREDICFDKYVPRMWAVIQMCITMAVYMGCKEIYMLGCEHTNIAIDIYSFMNQTADKSHMYDNESTLNRKMENLSKRNMESLLSASAEMFKWYEKIEDWCKSKGVKLVNCSPRTLISSIPTDDLDNIL